MKETVQRSEDLSARLLEELVRKGAGSSILDRIAARTKDVPPGCCVEKRARVGKDLKRSEGFLKRKRSSLGTQSSIERGGNQGQTYADPPRGERQAGR